MSSQDEIIKMLKDVYAATKNKTEVLLLGASAYVSFCKPRLWNEIIKPTGIFKTYSNFTYHMDRCQHKGWLRVLNNGAKGNHGQKTFEISEKGIKQLPVDLYTFVQLLVDGSSEELEIPAGGNVSVEIEAPKAQPEISDSDKIIYMCDLLEKTLLSKNESYGNSSLKPIGVFDLPRASKVQSRLEDKISRLAQVSRSGDKQALADTLLDLAGYSILYLIILEEE